MQFKRYRVESFVINSDGETKVKARKEADITGVLSSRSHMIEVCSESSFQPLLQLYLFLPTLLMSFKDGSALINTSQSVEDWFNGVSKLQFWSIFSSCICLSWSFNHYQAIRKCGALGFSSNPLGRILLLLSNAFQISSRLTMFVVFAYFCGDGNIWPMFVFVLFHIVTVSGLHFWEVRKHELLSTKREKIALVYESFLNGISNLYLSNTIYPPYKKGQQFLHKNQSKIQHWVTSIFLFENITIAILAKFLVKDVPDELLYFTAFGLLIGLGCKMIYYKFFHIWSRILEIRPKYDIE